MSLSTDILKEIPLSAVLKEKINTLETENDSLKTENASLKDDLRQLRQENQKLKGNTQSTPVTFHLDEAMECILIALAKDNDGDDEGVDKNALACTLRLPVARVEYYLRILEEHGYIFGVHNGTGNSYTHHLDQRGRAVLINRNMI